MSEDPFDQVAGQEHRECAINVETMPAVVRIQAGLGVLKYSDRLFTGLISVPTQTKKRSSGCRYWYSPQI